MSSNLVRSYFYVMSLLMLTSFVGSGGRLLYELLPPSSWQGATFAATGLILSAGIGIPHYRWIGREIAEDPNAATGLVRTLSLNLAQAVAALVALYWGISALMSMAGNLYDLEKSASTAVAGLAAFGLIQLERGRALPVSGASLVVQRVHLYLLQLSIVLTVIFVVVPFLALEILNGYLEVTRGVSQGRAPASGDWQLVLSISMTALWGTAPWVVYRILARGDIRSTLRLVAQYLGLGAGLVCVIVGLWRLAYLLIALLEGSAQATSAIRSVNWWVYFAAPLLIGLLITTGYALWLASESSRNHLQTRGTFLTAVALAAVLFGIAFFIGAARVLQSFVRFGYFSPTYGGLLIAGLAYPFLIYLLWQQSRRAPSLDAPRHAYLLAGLGIGLFVIVTFAALAIFALIFGVGGTLGPALGSYVQNLPKAVASFWQTLTTVPTCTPTAQKDCAPPVGTIIYYAIPVLIGGLVAAAHYWRVRAEKVLQTQGGPIKPKLPGATPTSILNELRAGNITHEQAVIQVQALVDATRTRGKPR